MVADRRQRHSWDDVDALAASIWADVVLRQSNLPTFYALEKELWLKRFGRTGRKWKRTGKYNKHAKGRRFSRKTLLQVDEHYPGTREWGELQLYRIIRVVPPTLEELISCTALVEPKLAARMRKIGVPRSSDDQRTLALLTHGGTIDALWRRGDLDALTALLALARFADHIQNEFLHADASWAARHVFMCVASRWPFHKARFRLYEILERNFFSRRYQRGIEFGKLTEQNIDDIIDLEQQAFLIAEDLSLINSKPGDYGRLIYWMFRDGFNDTLTALTMAHENLERAKQSAWYGKYYSLLESRLSADGRTNPGRVVGFLSEEIIRQLGRKAPPS